MHAYFVVISPTKIILYLRNNPLWTQIKTTFSKSWELSSFYLHMNLGKLTYFHLHAKNKRNLKYLNISE